MCRHERGFVKNRPIYTLPFTLLHVLSDAVNKRREGAFLLI